MTGVALQSEVRGKLKADAPLAPLVWFKSGGNAELLFEPADEADLVDFLKGLDPDVPVNTASVIKLPIMLEAMHQVKQGRLSFDDMLPELNYSI